MNFKYIPFEDAKKLINNGDVLLFRSNTWIGWILKKVGRGHHSHAAIAFWDESDLFLTEMKEIFGGRIALLKNVIERNHVEIDIYKVVPEFLEPIWEDNKLELKSVIYDRDGTIQCMKSLAGKKYDWGKIIWMAKRHMPYLRFKVHEEHEFDDTYVNSTGNVCSTAVAYCIESHFTDLIKNKANFAVEPADLARCPLLKYCFSIKKDEEK